MPTTPEQWTLFYWLLGLVGVLVLAVVWWFRWEQERQRQNLHKIRNTVQSIIRALLRHGIEVKRDDE